MDRAHPRLLARLRDDRAQPPHRHRAGVDRRHVAAQKGQVESDLPSRLPLQLRAIRALAPAVDTRVVFKDSGFADDIAKTNMAAILNQNGITDVRSL